MRFVPRCWLSLVGINICCVRWSSSTSLHGCGLRFCSVATWFEVSCILLYHFFTRFSVCSVPQDQIQQNNQILNGYLTKTDAASADTDSQSDTKSDTRAHSDSDSDDSLSGWDPRSKPEQYLTELAPHQIEQETKKREGEATRETHTTGSPPYGSSCSFNTQDRNPKSEKLSAEVNPFATVAKGEHNKAFRAASSSNISYSFEPKTQTNTVEESDPQIERKDDKLHDTRGPL